VAENKKRKAYRDKQRRALKKKGKQYQIRRGSSGDLVAIQISAQLNRVPKGFKITREILEEMIRNKANSSEGHWNGYTVEGAKEGDDPPGIRLLIIRWKNPDRDLPEDRGYRYATDDPEEQAQAWGSLRRIISSAALSVRISRNP